MGTLRSYLRGDRLAVLLGLGAVVLLWLAPERLRGLFSNTGFLALGTAALSLPIGALLGIVVAKMDVPGRRWLLWALAAQLFVPLYVQAAAWQSMLGSGGWLTGWMGGEPFVDPWLSSWRGAVWVHGMAAVPWAALAIAAALGSVERKLEEEALLDAGPWRVIARVSLPRASGGVAVAVAWIAMVTATEISVTDLFQIRTFAEEVYTQAALGPLVGLATGENGSVFPSAGGGGIAPGATVTAPSFATSFLASELAVGVTALVLIALAALCAAAPRLPPAAAIAADAGWRWRPRRGRTAIAMAAWLLLAAVVLAPLAGLVHDAGIYAERQGEHYVREWSASKAVTMVGRSPWEHRREIGWSLAISSVAVVVAAGVSLTGAWLIRQRTAARWAVCGALAAVAALPAPLGAAWVIAALNQPPDSALAPLAGLYDRTLAAPVIVQACRMLPLLTLWMWAQLASVPSDLLEAARSEGAGGWTRLVRVALPLRRRGLAMGVGAGFLVAAMELSGTLLVLPPGVTTVPSRIFQMLHYGIDDRAAALCLALFGATAAAAGVILAIGRRAAKSDDNG